MKRYWYLWLSFCVCAALLTALLPREGKLVLDYEEGRPWKYAPLIATFDFPIHKSEAVIKAEKDSAMRSFQPFFNFDAEVGGRQQEAFRAAYAAGELTGVSAACATHVSALLAQVYEIGVMSSETMSEVASRGIGTVRVVTGQEARSVSLASVYSTRSAYEYIMQADTARFPREMLARCRVNDFLAGNLLYDEQRTSTAVQDLMASIATNSGMVVSGQRIVDRGEIVNAEQQQILDSFVRESEQKETGGGNFWKRISGQAFLVVLLLAIFPIYLRMFRRDYFDSPHTVGLFFFLITIFPLLTYLMVRQNFFSIYVLPYAMVPLFVRIFFDSRTATFSLLVMLLLCSIGLRAPYEFLLLEVFMGLTAVYSMKELTERSQLIRIGSLVIVGGLALQFAYDMSQGIALVSLDRSRYVYIVVSGVLLLFAYPMMYLLERVFGFTSSVRLVELSNINNPLMRKLSKVAQGTFNHSMQVGNLAAEVADKIGARPQLARTAALYHDIGKILNPAFFTENQSGSNPHDDLQPAEGLSAEERSAQIIIRHVTDGVKLAEKYHLPKELRDFILTHHGRSHVKYFYVQWQNNHPGETPDESHFTYPGPNPSTKEQAILMMCDAVEASSRSLREYTEENIASLVNRIIDAQVSEGYFNQCDITFKDIADAKRVLVESLKTIYHTRIAYPELAAPAAEERIQPHRTPLFGGSFHRRH